MAYAALVSLAQVIEQILPHDKDYILLCQKNQLKSLHENVIFLQELLEELPGQLETRIRDVAYQLEDIIESYISRITFISSAIDDTQFHSTQMLFSAFRSCVEEVDSIMEETKKVTTKFTKEEISSRGDSSSVSWSSSKDIKVGLDEDLLEIKARVIGQEKSKLQVIPIVGMGGIGKTTLARNAYEDSLILEYFDVRCWVTVSQEYHLQDILLKLLSSKERIEGHVDKQSLILRLYQSLKGRRFLIVMDDMWNEELWYELKKAFPDDNNGSRVILTTRLSSVAAEIIDSSSAVHRMKFLNKYQSWSLLRAKVYGLDPCPFQMERIGRKISENCKGLPLAIVVIAGLLKINKTQDYWEKVARNTSEEAAATIHDQLLGILSWSYNNLPRHLKACFLYMGVFPEDQNIPVKTLIELWVAEGFLKPEKSKSMENVAEECLEDLVERSLILVTGRRKNNKIRFCSIHDALRELCLIRAQEEKFLQHFNNNIEFIFTRSTKNDLRRLIVHTSELDSLPDDIHDSPIRSLLYPYYLCDSSSQLLPFASNFKLLRVLDGLGLDGLQVEDSTIFKLIHLRYLGITYDCSSFWLNVSASIVKLQNLHTLKITQTPSPHILSLIELPLDLWRMPKLRNLILPMNALLDGPRKSSHVLHDLHTLSGILNFKFTKTAIRSLPNLKKLKVRYGATDHFNSGHWARFCLNNLIDMHQLEELNFRIDSENYNLDLLPMKLDFPYKLKSLTLRGCRMPLKNMTAIGSLPNLEMLKLMDESFVGEEWKPIEGEFLRLKFMKIKALDLEEWRAENYHFPCLEELIIEECRFEVPTAIGDIATLRKLTIRSCREHVEKSVRELQQEQLDYGNEQLEVRILSFDKECLHEQNGETWEKPEDGDGDRDEDDECEDDDEEATSEPSDQ